MEQENVIDLIEEVIMEYAKTHSFLLSKSDNSQVNQDEEVVEMI